MALQDVFSAVTISTDTTADTHGGEPGYVYTLKGDGTVLAQGNDKAVMVLLQTFWTQAQYDDGQ